MIALICLFVAVEDLLDSVTGWQDKSLGGHDEWCNDSRSHFTR